MGSENSAEISAVIAVELKALSLCSIGELRKKWIDLFRTQPPPAFGPDLLRRSIAHKIQEQAYGGLKPAIRRELNQLIKAFGKNPVGKIELPRRIKAGSVLVREWKGQTHRVTIGDDGFVYAGETYSTLSQIARQITGTRWNGPRFFGLRISAESKDAHHGGSHSEPRADST